MNTDICIKCSLSVIAKNIIVCDSVDSLDDVNYSYSALSPRAETDGGRL